MRRSQRGQVLGWLIVVLLLVGLVMQLVRIVPHYLDHRTLRHVLEDMVADERYTLASPAQFRNALQERLRRNNLRSIDLGSAVQIEPRATGLRIHVDYEVREPLFGNMVLVLEFRERYDSALQ